MVFHHQFQNKDLIVDPETDYKELDGAMSILCNMYDETDPGYTRAPIEVYQDRFEEMEDDGTELKNISKLKEFLKENEIEYIEVRP